MVTELGTGDPVAAADAPVRSVAEIEIDAPIEIVWNVLTAIDEWATWTVGRTG